MSLKRLKYEFIKILLPSRFSAEWSDVVTLWISLIRAPPDINSSKSRSNYDDFADGNNCSVLTIVRSHPTTPFIFWPSLFHPQKINWRTMNLFSVSWTPIYL